MKINKYFYFSVKNGKMKIEDMEGFKKTLSKFEGKDGWLLLQSNYRQRTLPENRYLFGVVIKILKDTPEFSGWDSIEVYRWLEWKFLNDYPKEIHEWVSIKNLSTVDFEELMTRIREWGAIELGIYIPEPNEVDIQGDIIL
ncbi:MAG: hypothetical protein ACTSXK_11270 [Promethearchaeota archaeon]